MKTLNKKPTLEITDLYGEEILNVAHSLDNTENEISVEYFETGGLIGFNAIIYNNNNILVVDGKAPKYIILNEKLANEWSSFLEINITDNEEEMLKHYYRFEEIATEEY